MLRRGGARLRELANVQDDVVSRAQLRELGVSRHGVASEVRGGRWQVIGRQVVVLHNGPLLEGQRHWAAVLHAGSGAVLFGASALRAHGVALPEPAVVHVAVPRGSHATSLTDERVEIRIRELRRSRAADVHPVLAPPRHRLARAVIDAASLASSDGSVRSLVCLVVQQRRATVPALRAAVDDTHRVRNRRVVREVLDDIEGGSESLPELAFLRIVRRAALPVPTRQRKLRRAGGTWYLDAAWARFRLVVEVDGAQHQDFLAREADAARDRELAIDGVLCVRFSSWVVRRDPELVARTLERLLCSRGWRPAARAA
jgi:very-short-patch-repair endonuclease